MEAFNKTMGDVQIEAALDANLEGGRGTEPLVHGTGLPYLREAERVSGTWYCARPVACPSLPLHVLLYVDAKAI